MQNDRVVTGWEVLYQSDDDSFRTVQTHMPVAGRHYKPVEVVAVILEPLGGWSVDSSDPSCPKVVHPKHSMKPLNKAIRDGIVKVSQPLNHRTPQQKAS